MLNLVRGGAVWQLVGLITRRSQVQILPPLPTFNSYRKPVFFKSRRTLPGQVRLPNRQTVRPLTTRRGYIARAEAAGSQIRSRRNHPLAILSQAISPALPRPYDVRRITRSNIRIFIWPLICWLTGQAQLPCGAAYDKLQSAEYAVWRVDCR